MAIHPNREVELVRQFRNALLGVHCLVMLLTGVALDHAAAAETTMIVGVNRVHIGWLKAEDRSRVLETMASAGVTDVRLSLSEPVAASVQAVIQASQLGMKVLLELPLGESSLYPASVRPKSGNGHIWNMFPMSEVDVEKFRARLVDSFAELDAAHVRLEAVEVGNEINWAPYNGDLEVAAPAVTSLPETEDENAGWNKSLIKYKILLQTARTSMRASDCCRDALLISAGLADVPQPMAHSRGLQVISVPTAVQSFRDQGIIALIDRLGLHTYPSRTEDSSKRSADLEQYLGVCGAETKVCWLTEWGVSSSSADCKDDEMRQKAVANVRAVIAQSHREHKVDGIFVYDWDTARNLSIFRCNALTPSGVLALEK